MTLLRPTMVLLLVPLAAGCGSAKASAGSEPEHASVPEADGDAVHEALVAAHRRAVEECFGGFGKGAPYAATLTIGDGGVSGAEVEPLSDGHGELPADCIAKHLRETRLPAGTSSGSIKARFAVDNPDCDLPACPERDLPCTFKRDIACTVVIDE